jgi:2-polyprenyl-3-methyl-5-hydroxy-6-metoxy-1,4-benzoquinol methylase
MIDLEITRVKLDGPMAEVQVPQEQYQHCLCPICLKEDDSILISEVRAGNLTSMESAYCTSCEHRYFRKMPRIEWLNRYYAERFDAGQTELTKPRRSLSASLRKVPAIDTAFGKIANALRREQPALRQLRAFLEGIVETNGTYYLKRADIHKVLEVGCGYGAKLAMFRRAGYQAYGVEASRQRAEDCRRQGLNVFDCPVTNLDPVLSEGPFDLVYSIHVLEHIADISAHLGQVSKLIREGGILYIQVPNLWRGETLFMQSHAAIHCHTFSLHSLATLMRKHGFTPVRVQADNNLHILASKAPGLGSEPRWTNTAAHEQLLECLLQSRLHEETRYRVTFDHSRVEVRRLDIDQIIYRREVCFAVQGTPYSHCVEFSTRVGAESVSFPVRFLYSEVAPPLWVKSQ